MKVQFRDAADPRKIHVPTFDIPYDPQDGKIVRVRKHADDERHQAYRIVRHDLYEAVINDPTESGIVLMVTPVDG